MASREDVQKFISEVKDLEAGKQRRFKIALFGGEPLLNIQGVKLVAEAFKNDDRCQLNVITNGDFLNQQNLDQFPTFLWWRVTAYDFQTNLKKYLDLAKSLNHISFSYTFVDLDLDKMLDFKRFAREQAKVQYKISFSHSPKSWNLVPVEILYSKVKSIVCSELEDIINDGLDIPVQSILADQYLKMLIWHVSKFRSQKGIRISPTCLSQDKASFYRGQFSGKCFRLSKSDEDKLSSLTMTGCKGCDYEAICAKSCIAEASVDGEVNEKLCAIQRACFDAVCEFAKNHQCDQIWRDKVLMHYLDTGAEGDDEDYGIIGAC